MAQSAKSSSAADTQLEIRSDWLALHKEDIVEPDLPVIDSHHHLWDPPGRRYLFDEFLGDVRTGHNVVATVFSPCRAMYKSFGPEELRPVGETEFVAGIAAQSESGAYGTTRVCAGIVSSLDFNLGDRVEPVLEAHISAGGGRFRGIRGRTSWHESPEVHQLPTPPHVLRDAKTRQAIQSISKMGLTLDIWAFHTQLDEVIEICRLFPELPIVINHLGGPIGIGPFEGKRSEVFAAWRRDLEILGTLPNTFLKIGGLAMRFTGWQFYKQASPPTSDDLVMAWRPYVDAGIQAFGPKRCMFETNFPVDKAMCSYPVLWNAYKKIISSFSKEEKVDMLAGCAARFYRLDDIQYAANPT